MPGHGKNQEEDALFVQLWRSQEVARGSPEVLSGWNFVSLFVRPISFLVEGFIKKAYSFKTFKNSVTLFPWVIHLWRQAYFDPSLVSHFYWLYYIPSISVTSRKHNPFQHYYFVLTGHRRGRGFSRIRRGETSRHWSRLTLKSGNLERRWKMRSYQQQPQQQGQLSFEKTFIFLIFEDKNLKILPS